MILEKACVGLYEVNCYILAKCEGGKAVLIDPGAEEDKINSVLSRYNLKPGLIINTHGHIDHIGVDDAFGVCVHIHKDDIDFLDNPNLNLSRFLAMPLQINSPRCLLEDRQIIECDGIKMQVLHTPGHTPGGICILLREPKENILFSGDTLFYQGIGRTDCPLGSFEQLRRSIETKLFVLDNQTKVYPGHGPETTIGAEKQSNPFLSE